VLTIAHEGLYNLTVIDAPQGESLARVLRRSSTPVLLVRGARAVSCWCCAATHRTKAF
jgi:LSD1 subclass zinc finger protein